MGYCSPSFITACPALRVTWGAGAHPNYLREKVGYTLDQLLVYLKANTDRQTTVHTLAYTYRQFRGET